MGGSTSKAFEQICKVTFDLDKAYHYPGEKIRGLINLDVKQDLQIRQMDAFFIGTESASVKFNTSKQNQDQHRDMESCIQQKQQVLQIFQNGKCPKGKFHYPFEFQIDHDLPGSVELKFGKGTAKVQYVLQIEFYPSKIGGKVMKIHKEINICQTYRKYHQQIERYINPKGNINQTSLFCFGKGHTSVEFSLNKPFYVKGDVGVLTLNVDNTSSSSDIDNMTLIIQQITQIGKTRQQLTTQKNSIIDALTADTKHTFKKVRNLYKQNLNQKMKARTKNNQFDVYVPLDNLDQYTTLGYFFSVEYIISIQANYDGFFVKSDSDVHIPLIFLPDQLQIMDMQRNPQVPQQNLNAQMQMQLPAPQEQIQSQQQQQVQMSNNMNLNGAGYPVQSQYDQSNGYHNTIYNNQNLNNNDNGYINNNDNVNQQMSLVNQNFDGLDDAQVQMILAQNQQNSNNQNYENAPKYNYPVE